MADRLQQLLDMQDRLEQITTGHYFSDLAKFDSGDDSFNREERIRQFKEMFIALVRELVEALDEAGTKPWATSKHWNEAALQKEVIDAWHFLLAITLLSGMDAHDVYHAYKEKWLINVDRQGSNYDGVSTKCRKCKRALDDPSTQCLRYDDNKHINDGWCVDGGYYKDKDLEEVSTNGNH